MDESEALPIVLLVEDDEPLAGIVARHLRARGYATEVIGTAEAALQALRDGLRPSVILLDINLPNATGWTVVRSPELATAGSPPVVVVSATTIDPGRLASHHVAGYLPKPFPMETLVQTIERLGAGPTQDV